MSDWSHFTTGVSSYISLLEKIYLFFLHNPSIQILTAIPKSAVIQVCLILTIAKYNQHMFSKITKSQ